MTSTEATPIRDNRRQAKFLYWTGLWICAIAGMLDEKEKTVMRGKRVTNGIGPITSSASAAP